MSKKLLFALVAALTLGSFAQATTQFPKTFAEFEKLSAKEMAALPDLKWPMHQTVNAADLKAKSETELAILRNSVYAQYGYPFSQKSLAQYFGTRSWYHAANEETQPLPADARAAADVYLAAQATHHGDRNVADEGGHSATAREHASYSVMKMGFCTYAGQYSDPAGVVIFELGGKAHLFHSVASQFGIDDGYDGYKSDNPELASSKSRLIDATWSIETGKTPDSAKILLTIAAADIPKNYDGKPAIAAGVREVLNYKDGSSFYTVPEKHRCSMLVRAAQPVH